MLTLNKQNREDVDALYKEIINIGLDFKLQTNICQKQLSDKDREALLSDLPEKGQEISSIVSEFQDTVLPYCTNFSSEHFMGFPDAGNSTAAIAGSILKEFSQQNLINQSFCAPSATFIDIAVIKWLREAVGYTNQNIKNIWDVGGIITPGGTVSNTIGVLLGREYKHPGSMERGVNDPGKCLVVVPKGIGHYSVKSGAMWIGCGNNLVEVNTINYRYDLDDLEEKLKEHAGKIMMVVAYAGDSRTMTVDNFEQIYKLVKKIDKTIWLHADACHGFSLGFSKKLKHKLNGIHNFDSITVDPHKVMLMPYTLSALLVKNTADMKNITSLSDLIMQEDFAFGQITPFLGSRSWESLKLWFMMKHFGQEGLDELINNRYKLAKYLEFKLNMDDDFLVLNKVEINSVMFVYKKGLDSSNIESLNVVNKKIHNQMLLEGKYHLHQFSIEDSGVLKKGEVVYPLRFMCGNPNVTTENIDKMIEYVRSIGLVTVTKLYEQ